jgi:DNA (cytosine-5)-methyltransferase 1
VPVGNIARASDLLEEDAVVEWHIPDYTRRLLSMMTKANRNKIGRALSDAQPAVGFLYRRTRAGVQRAEVRFDGICGCLRTPGGGSSRQTVVVVRDGAVRTRLLSPREAARFMGLPDSFLLPAGHAEAYHAMGDGVAAPVVAWLSDHLLSPIAESIGLAGSAGPRAAPGLSLYHTRAQRRASNWLRVR